MEAIALPSSLHKPLTRPEQSLQIHDDLKPQVIKKLEDLIKYTLQSHWNSAPQGSTYALELLKKSLQDLQAHFTILTGILNAKTTEEITVVYSKNKVISKMYTKITEASLVSLVPLNDALDHVVKVTFEELKEISCNLSNHKNSDRMKISAYKLATIAEYLPGLVQIATDDIFFYPRSSSVWEKLHQHTEYKHFKNKNAVLRSIHKFSLKLTLANAIIYQNSKKRNEFVGTLSGLSSVGNHKKTQMMSSLYLSNPSMDTAFKVWNLPDRKGFKEFYKLRLPWIDYDKKIYIPRLFSHITRESVLKEYQDGSLQKIKEDGSPMKPVELSEHKDGVVKSLFIPDSKRIKIRILSSKPLKIRHPKLEKVGETFYKLRQKLKAKFFSHDIDGVIIHIHGGGFVSMSSSMHRNYLIRWAKAMNVVIFSIDYRLAPEHPYPAAIEDVWQAYNWLTHYSESILGIPMHNIVVAGDSAGGNLAASLALRTIREGARIPDGLLLSYPALNLFPFKFVPSYLQAISDVFLPANLLKLCLKAYIPEEFRPESDPFLSPAIASDELLSKMPPVRMISGTLDPLHDDVWTFAERLLKLEKDVKVTLFEDLPHGFLSLDEILEYDVVVSTAAEKLNELFGMAKDAKGNLLNQSKIMIKEMVGFS